MRNSAFSSRPPPRSPFCRSQFTKTITSSSTASWQASLPKSPSSSDSIRTSPHCRLRWQRSRMQITLPSPRAGAKQSAELQITFAKPTYRSRSSFAEFFWTVPQNGEENVKQTLSESNRQLPAPQGRNRQTAEKI